MIVTGEIKANEEAPSENCRPRGKQVYSVLPDNEKILVYDDPEDSLSDRPRFKVGQGITICALGLEATVKNLKNKNKGLKSDVNFRKVKIIYKAPYSGVETQSTGWVKQQDISYRLPQSPYGKKTSKPERCEKNQSMDKDLLKTSKSILNISNNLIDDNTKKAKKLIAKQIGTCLKEPMEGPDGQKKEDLWWKEVPRQSIYDRIVLDKKNRAIFDQVPDVKKENGERLTKQDLMDIDVLARTIYGEMDGCQKGAIQNFMAVAKVGLNRADIIDHAQELAHQSEALLKPNSEASDKEKAQAEDNLKYAVPKISQYQRDDKHSSYKSSLAKVLTAHKQYQNWSLKLPAKNPDFNKNKPEGPKNQEYILTSNRSNVLRTLCPQKKSDGWDKALLVATDAIVNPKAFREKTKEVVQMHYTSSLPYYAKTEQVFPKIEGAGFLNIDRCVRIWDDKPEHAGSRSDSKMIAMLNGHNVDPRKIPRVNPDPSIAAKDEPASKELSPLNLALNISYEKFQEILNFAEKDL